MRLGLLALSLVPVLSGCGDPAPPSPFDPGLDFRPNILWIVAEDMSPDIPAYGDSTISTPSLDRLARDGIRFTRFFASAPVCAPARASIATGLYPTHMAAQHMRTTTDWEPWTGVPAYEAVPPPSIRMLSEHFRMAGYYTSNNPKEDYQFRKPVTAWDESGRQAGWWNREPGQPFYSVFNIFTTHESRIWANANDSLWVPVDLAVTVPPYLPDTDSARQDLRIMYSNILRMDAEVGRILDRLEADGLADSTIVVWYTDHGGPLPRQKRSLTDAGLHVPMFVRFPNGWRSGSTDERLVSFVDLAPTMLSLAGIRPPDGLDGRPALGRFADSQPRRYVHASADRFDTAYDGVRAVRDERFKYLRHLYPDSSYFVDVPYRRQQPIMRELLRLRDTGRLTDEQAPWFRDTRPPEELFDTESDPYELHNLASELAFADKLAELRAETDRWMTSTGDPGTMPETELLATLWPEGTQPVTAPPRMRSIDGLASLTSETAGASIGYQFLPPGGSIGRRWMVYVAPVRIPTDYSLAAVAHRIGYIPSDTVMVGAK